MSRTQIFLMLSGIMALLLLHSWLYPYSFTAIAPPKVDIIAYIHICQVGDWRRSLQIITHSIMESGLYEAIKEFRIGVVSDDPKLYSAPLEDPKYRVFFGGKSSEYERPTLLHMRAASETDDPNTRYCYTHSKGIRHFGTPNEACVLDWIELMLYWNVEHWRLALEKLQYHDTYGCNYTGIHYSGNFWWSTNKCIQSRSTSIPSYYTAPEDWICAGRSDVFSIFNSGLQGNGHYDHRYPRHIYAPFPKP